MTTSAEAPKQERSNGSARNDQYRNFEWFAPKRRRSTLYEDVTLDTQPSVHRHWRGPYPKYFADGRPPWWEDSTKLRSGDWYAFRDPHADWERTYYQQASALEGAIENACEHARADRLYDDFPESWVAFLRDNLHVLAFVDYGLWLPVAQAQRDCLSDSLAHVVGFEAGMKQRQFQAIVLYGMELDERFGDFTVAHGKKRLLEHEAFQPLRRYLERLRTVTDWCERIFAINVCFEPTIGTLLRRELFTRAAVAHGDSVTTEVMRAAQTETAVVRAWTEELCAFVLNDPQYGPTNRKTIAQWRAEWSDMADEAIRALRPVFELGATGTVSYDVCHARLEDDLQALLARTGLTEMEATA